MSLKILGPRPYFWQWDSGQKLVVGNCNCDEVHFCNGTTDNALVAKIKTTDDGTRTVDVPNILLQAAEPLKAYLFHRNDSGNMTRTRYIFQVIERPKPEDYIYTEDEILTWQRLSDRIDDLEDNVDCVKTVNDVLPDENGNIEVDVKETLVVAAPSSFPARVSTTGDMIAQAFANKRNVILKFPDGDICNLDSISGRTAVFSKIYIFEGGVGRAVYKVDAGGRCTYSEEIVESSGGNAVLYTKQNLTEEQRAQARENIGVGNGKSAYQYAKDGGYTGTEEEFAQKLAADGGSESAEPVEDDIPKVFFGHALPQTKDETVMSFRYISKTQDISGYCKTKAQGNSSMSYPKKNQTVKLYKDAECSEKLKVDFKGWGEQNKFCFKANWIDLTHARNVVSARLWGDVLRSREDYESLPELLRTSPNQGAVDGFPVKVYAAGVYQGRYTINIPKDGWMANMDDKLDTHCILCGENYISGCFRAAANIDESDWTDELHDTVPVSIKTRWNEAITFINNSTDDAFVAGIGNFFDVASLIDYYLFGLATCGLDAFGKNQLYMTYDGQKWYASMYDMDSTWGLWWDGTSFVPTNYSRSEFQDFKDGNGNLLYIRLESLFADAIKARWEELKNGVLSAESIINRFERFTDICPPWLVTEDYASTTVNGAFANIPSQETNNIQQIRSFVLNRLKYVNSCLEDSEYETLEYIESTGTQYIDTGVNGVDVVGAYEIKLNTLGNKAVAYGQYLCGDANASVPKLMDYSCEDKGVVTQATNNGFGNVKVFDNTDEIHTVTYNSDGAVYVDGASVRPADNVERYWGNLTWYVFSSHEEPNLAPSMRLYYLKMWFDGVLVRDFVPVRRQSDGAIGLHDNVTQTFFDNIGTGTFNAPA